MDHESIQSEPQPQADNPWLKEGLFNDVDNVFNPERKASVELPTSSSDFVCDCYLKEIAHMGKMGELTDFVNEALSTSPREYASPEEFLNANPGYAESVHQMSEQDKAALREYTGPDYAFINSLARGFWDYEKMGRQDDETEKRFLSKINDIHQAIMSVPAPAEDYITYRGTNMREFTGYDLGSISNLKNLEGQFFVEKGFMSTSLTKEHSYTEQDLSGTLHDKCDIEIRYHSKRILRRLKAFYFRKISLYLYSPWMWFSRK